MYFLKKLSLGLLVLAFLIAPATPAISSVEIYSGMGLLEKVSFDGLATFIYRYDKNTRFHDGEDFNWAESGLNLHMNFDLKNDIELRAGFVYNGTYGTDSYSLWGVDSANKSDLSIDEAYVKIKNLFGQEATLTLGKQKIALEKEFLIKDGLFDFRQGVWLNVGQAFPMAARIDAEFGKLSTTAFYAQVDTTTDPLAEQLYGGDLDFGGLNLHYTINDNNYVYGGLMASLNGDKNAVFAGHVGGGFNVPTLNTFGGDTYALYLGADSVMGNLHLEGEIVKQFGEARGTGHDDVDRDAWGGFIGGTYTFAETPMTPYINIKGWYQSGDDPDTEVNENFVVISQGFNDYGRWCAGEITGELFLIGGTNYYTAMTEIGFFPAEWMQVRMQYFSNYFAEEEAYGLSDDKISDEFNVIARFFPKENIIFDLIGGIAEPGDGGEAHMDLSDETAYLLQTNLAIFF